MYKWYLIFFFYISFPAAFSQNVQSKFHDSTNWILKASVKNDALCLINTMMGDPFYLKYYNTIYLEMEPKFTPAVRESLSRLRKYKDENRLIVSAWLTKRFLALPDSSLQFILEAFKDRSIAKGFGKIQKDIANIIQYLIDINFEKEYEKSVMPQVRQRIDTVYPRLAKYNIVPQIEKIVGVPLQTDSVIFYLVKYTQPHGINLSSNSFISDISYNTGVSLKVSIHEMLHPYFINNNFGIKKEYTILSKDTFIYNAFINHDKSFGYNDFEGYIEESIVRVLEQIISEKFNLVKDRLAHWKQEDKGMHVFGAILYSEMLIKSFPEKYNGSFKDFLVESVADIKAAGGKVFYDKLYTTN